MKDKKLRQLIIIALCIFLTVFGFIMQGKGIKNSQPIASFFEQDGEETTDGK